MTIISGVLSVLAIAGVLLGTGSFSEDIDRDLDFSGASPDWLGRRSFNDFVGRDTSVCVWPMDSPRAYASRITEGTDLLREGISKLLPVCGGIVA